MTKMRVGFRCVFSEIAGYLAAVLLLAAGCQAPGKPKPPEGAGGDPRNSGSSPAAAALDAWRAQSLENLDATLVSMDAAVGQHQLDPDFWELYGVTMIQLMVRELAAGRSTSHLPEDAADALHEALKLDPGRTSARVSLAHAQRLGGDAAAAWTSAAQAWSELDRDQADLADLEEIGRCGLLVTIQSLQAGGAVPAAAEVSELALRSAVARGGWSACLPLFDLHAWQKHWEPAAEAARMGLLADPPRETLYERLRGLGGNNRNLQVATLEAVRRGKPNDGPLLWYSGEALFFQGREARTSRDTLKALEAFQRAEECFLQAQSARPDFAASCQEWLHLIRVQQAWLLRDEGRSELAAAALVAALAAAPERLEAKAEPDTLRLAIEAVAADLNRARNLAAARQFLRDVCAIHGSNADWLNNLGFFCRELGVAAAEAGDAQSAADLFEESWSVYSRAAELAPEDARIVNDRALIAVYYLDEHWDLAEQELHKAIQIGTRQLAELPSDVPETEHRYVDEAVGDAWENLAYLQLMRRHRTEQVEEFLAESLKHFPHERRSGVIRLREQLSEALRQP